MWRRGYISLLALLLAVGCGSGLEGPPGERGEFEVYFQTFEAESLAHGRSTRGDGMITIAFGDLEKKESGRCEWGFFQRRIILVAEARWKVLSEKGREALIFHELGHCLLKREHLDTRVETSDLTDRDDPDFAGTARSVMHMNCVSGSQYAKWRQYYVDELFTPGTPLPQRRNVEPTTTP